MSDFYVPMSGYQIVPAQPSGYDDDSFGFQARDPNVDYSQPNYDRDVLETMKEQGLLNDQQYHALLQGIGRAAGAWNVATGQQSPPPPPEPTMEWIDGAAFVGGAAAAGWLLGKLFSGIW